MMYEDNVYGSMSKSVIDTAILLKNSKEQIGKWFDDWQDGWCMYFWIPQEIHMKRGKMAGQVAHASARLSRMMTEMEWGYYTNNEVKIVYKVASIESMIKVQEKLLKEYPVEYHTLIFDNTLSKFTVFGIATKRDLRKMEWKLA